MKTKEIVNLNARNSILRHLIQQYNYNLSKNREILELVQSQFGLSHLSFWHLSNNAKCLEDKGF